jgi:hypothetical protein
MNRSAHRVLRDNVTSQSVYCPMKPTVAHEHLPSIYESKVPFNTGRIQAAAIYCSDGRFGDQIDDFLHHELRLPRYDRVTVPGGPACLAGHFPAYRHEEAVIDSLKFLVKVHHISRIVLIAHQNCAFYLDYLKVHSIDILERQREDMMKAVRRVHDVAPHVKIDAYFARLCDNQIRFQTLDQMMERGQVDE